MGDTPALCPLAFHKMLFQKREVCWVSNASSVQFSSVQSLSHVQLFATPWITTCQASLSINNSWNLLKLMFIELVMPSSHLILCRPLLLLPPIPPSIRVFSNESTLCMRWPKYWSFSFSIIPSKEHPGLISFRMDWSPSEWLDLLAVQGTLVSSPKVLTEEGVNASRVDIMGKLFYDVKSPWVIRKFWRFLSSPHMENN